MPTALPPERTIKTALAAIVDTMRSAYGANGGPWRSEAPDFGHDPQFLLEAEPLLNFLWSRYFRVRLEGIEHVPETGPALLVGNHSGGIPYDGALLLQLRIETLERYGQNEVLARTITDPGERAARLRQLAEGWARQFDPNSMIALRKAAVKFDAERDFSRVRAKVLYVLSRTDKIFPPSIAPGVMDKLSRARVDAKYFEIDTELGHSASGPESAKWAPTLKEFIAGLER